MLYIVCRRWTLGHVVIGLNVIQHQRRAEWFVDHVIIWNTVSNVMCENILMWHRWAFARIDDSALISAVFFTKI